MTEKTRWDCPLCENPYWNWKDALDHIVKAHIKEYADKYHRSYSREFARVFS